MSQLQLRLFSYCGSPHSSVPVVIVPELMAPDGTHGQVPEHVIDAYAVGAQAVQAVAPRLAFCPVAQAVQASSPVVDLKVP